MAHVDNGGAQVSACGTQGQGGVTARRPPARLRNGTPCRLAAKLGGPLLLWEVRKRGGRAPGFSWKEEIPEACYGSVRRVIRRIACSLGGTWTPRNQGGC